jgi:hypothetical protein
MFLTFLVLVAYMTDLQETSIRQARAPFFYCRFWLVVVVEHHRWLLRSDVTMDHPKQQFFQSHKRGESRCRVVFLNALFFI